MKAEELLRAIHSQQPSDSRAATRMMRSSSEGERQPLLHHAASERDEQSRKVDFDDDDAENPRNWSLGWKYAQTLQLFMLGFVCPMASSIVAPAKDDIAKNLGVSPLLAALGQTGFVCMLGVGPLFHAPMSETFGRRIVYLLNLAMFTLLQIPTALAPNAAVFITARILGGFFGSVGVANGGGSISDMFETGERAKVLGFYLCAPLISPCVGALVGSMVIGSDLEWRWIFWIVAMVSGSTWIFCYFFLYETQAKIILDQRKSRLEKRHPDLDFTVPGEASNSLLSKIAKNSTKAVKILFGQPIVLIMSLYQALVFSSMYSLYSQYMTIWSSTPYNFTPIEIGLAFLGPAVGFIVTAIPIILCVDKVYNWLADRYGDGTGRPEYRLPLANVGAVLLPSSLFWLGWSLDRGLSWHIPLAATLFFGGSQVSIFTAVQTYYVDAFEGSAASALAAGAFLRSMLGGIVPLFAGPLFEKLGYGWGWSVFGVLGLILMPAPLVFFWVGERLRERFAS